MFTKPKRGTMLITNIFNYLNQLDFPILINLLYSICLVYFDCRTLSYPLIIWYMSFLFLTLTLPFNSLVLICLIIAILTEMLSLHIGSGDWLYLSLLAFSINWLQLIYCILFGSIIAMAYMLGLSSKKQKIPFTPFLLIGYLLSLYFIKL